MTDFDRQSQRHAAAFEASLRSADARCAPVLCLSGTDVRALLDDAAPAGAHATPAANDGPLRILVEARGLYTGAGLIQLVLPASTRWGNGLPAQLFVSADGFPGGSDAGSGVDSTGTPLDEAIRRLTETLDEVRRRRADYFAT